MKSPKHKIILFVMLACLTLALGALLLNVPAGRKPVKEPTSGKPKTLKLYWFIPDGLRADPITFPIFQWAEDGLLPNLKKMIDAGSYGYSRPVFPGHTPTNFATLLTGAPPKVHGIADGPMHIEGYPLKMVSKGGFSSVAKKVPPIWYTLEENGLLSTLLSVPGSTPPELDLGITIRGRWGGWGMDFPAIIFHSATDKNLRHELGVDNRVFNFGSELTRFVEAAGTCDWQAQLPKSFSGYRELVLENWGSAMYACLADTTDDATINFDQVVFSHDRRRIITALEEGQWSSWLPVRLAWETQNDYNIFTPKRMAWERGLSSVTVDTEMAVNVIKLGNSDLFRIRFVYNNLNRYLVKPADFTPAILHELGPMIDFPDNYPPQLIYYPEDKATFLEESRRSLAWHKNMAGYMLSNFESDVIIHDIYTPNQLLSSRWWLGGVDPAGSRYSETDPATRQALWKEILEVYSGIDAILGEILAHADAQTVIVFSSDHGMVPLNQEVRLNNLFAKHGLLTFSIDPQTGISSIDWEHTRAIFLKMDNIYLNPDGLAGNYRRPSGPRYVKLRQEVISLLNELVDAQGRSPVSKIVKWEEAETELGLPTDRVGDLVIANKPTYGWVEDVSADGNVFVKSLKSGYKQAIIPEETDAMLTPFVIMGPGVKSGYQLGEPIRHIDQYPTIMTLLHQSIPDFVEGRVLDEIISP